MLPPPTVGGSLRDHPEAEAFAQVVQQVHHRYANEVVGAFRLCPFMQDPAQDYGRFCVMLEREPTVATAVELLVGADEPLAHLVYPLISMESTDFERFGSALHKAAARAIDPAPVHAVFHPRMAGDATTPARLVGLVRRAPDPFVQFVPEGLQKGGTVFADLSSFDATKWMSQKEKKTLRQRVSDEDIARIEALQRDIKAERDDRYARFVDALG